MAVNKIYPPWDLDDTVHKPVTSRTRTFADAIFQAIIDGDHRYGTRLPAERVLCEEYGLSRNTVRQALDLLDHYKVIKRHAGSGSVVCYREAGIPTPQDIQIIPDSPTALDLCEISEITSPLELGVMRSIIEPEIARLAVLSMTTRDIQKLNKIQHEMEAITVDGKKFASLDDDFRMQIAKGTHNPMLIAVYTMVNYVCRTADWAEQRRRALTPRRIREYQLQNKSLCEAISNREIETAVEYLKLSLAEFHQDLMRGV